MTNSSNNDTADKNSRPTPIVQTCFHNPEQVATMQAALSRLKEQVVEPLNTRSDSDKSEN